MHYRLRSPSRGFATITTVLILAIAFAFGLVLIAAVLSGRAAGRTLQAELSAEQIAEAGLNKAVFCLNATSGTNCGGSYGTAYTGETDVSFGGGSFTTTLTGGGATRSATSAGTSKSGQKFTILATVTAIPPTDSTAFSYALQSGSGGAYMSNNSSISGTIYSNGNIDCQTTQAVVTGDGFVTLSGGHINACTISYNAHADNVLNSKVGGDAYYLTDPSGISGTTVTGAKFSGSATPSAAAMPSLDLDFWRNSASAGGIIYGDYSPANGAKIGPIEITGNLIMNNNVAVTIEGPIWVQGNITTGNNSSFTLDSSFGSYSTVILADDPNDMIDHGKITITNNTVINGSGDPKSHILFASTNNSTNDSAPALQVANNSSGAVFYALNGVMRLSNNAGAKSLAGYRLYLDQGASVTYVESDFSGQFSNSPAGRWYIQSGTWRQAK